MKWSKCSLRLIYRKGNAEFLAWMDQASSLEESNVENLVGGNQARKSQFVKLLFTKTDYFCKE